jgi:hypothetical protein
MSIQTTLARIAAEAAAAEAAAHRRHCPGCTGRWRCQPGRQLDEARSAALEKLGQQRQADQQPDPGQVPLWV